MGSAQSKKALKEDKDTTKLGKYEKSRKRTFEEKDRTDSKELISASSFIKAETTKTEDLGELEGDLDTNKTFDIEDTSESASQEDLFAQENLISLKINDSEIFVTPKEYEIYTLIVDTLNQAHLFEQTTAENIKSILKDLLAVEKQYVGGIQAYIKNAKSLLKDSFDNINKYERFTIQIPPTFNPSIDHQTYIQHEEIGISQLQYCCFVLVAGGLGERLGYSDIKINLPSETLTMTSYINLYCLNILAYQSYIQNTHNINVKLPLAIMTSDDTHASTQNILKSNNFFGLQKNQITLIKQGRVPTLMDNNARMSISKTDPAHLDMKPHGHGDVHTLLLNSGLIEKWEKEGRKWILFFQDTNGLTFKSFPVFLAVSYLNDLAMNSLAIPRHPDDAVGAICKLTEIDTGLTWTTNVEYNILDSLFATNNIDKYTVDENGYSLYPGNSNIIILNISHYHKVLNRTKGSIPEFVNPKYTNSSKTEFKTPTRLECMMQDIALLFDKESKVGCTQIDRKISFSPLKNNITDAAVKSQKEQSAECAFTAESDQYNSSTYLFLLACHLKNINVKIDSPKEYTFANVKYKMGPQVVYMPSWAFSVKQIMSHLGEGDITISQNSSLLIEGNVNINGLNLKGNLKLTANSGETLDIQNINIENSGYDIQALDSNIKYDDYYNIRGYYFNHSKVCEIRSSSNK